MSPHESHMSPHESHMSPHGVPHDPHESPVHMSPQSWVFPSSLLEPGTLIPQGQFPQNIRGEFPHESTQTGGSPEANRAIPGMKPDTRDQTGTLPDQKKRLFWKIRTGVRTSRIGFGRPSGVALSLAEDPDPSPDDKPCAPPGIKPGPQVSFDLSVKITDSSGNLLSLGGYRPRTPHTPPR